MSTPSSSILIIGAGTWGTSTALSLARRGYSRVTVLDKYPVPSPISAGNDINKILDLNRESGSNEAEKCVSRRLYDAVMIGWRDDPVFKDFFHETGMIIAASSPEGIEHVKTEEGIDDGTWTDLKSAEDFRSTMPAGVLRGEFPSWWGWWKKSGCGAGWVHARKAMESAAGEAASLGVTFVTGEAGDVIELLVEDGDIVGARSRDMTEHRADRMILCAGANASTLLDMQSQLLPKSMDIGPCSTD
jgi:sarcosine oxidase / L-pipecolate oxidase